ncbi:MAG: C39 family peptidase [Nocardioidaceae bacterium]|nr:C39 family peptidase [Nocardioidaceae bacterium]
MHRRPTVLMSLVLLALVATLPPASAVTASADPQDLHFAVASAAAAAATPVKRVVTTRWGPAALASGRHERTTATARGLVLGRDPRRVTYDDPYGTVPRLAYDRGRWLSPWTRPGFGFDELIASSSVDTPVGTFVEVSVRGTTSGARRSSWDSLGRWASHDRNFHRMSLGDQQDDFSRVVVDTLVTRSGVTYRSWQLRVTLMSRVGNGKTPTVRRLAVMASRLPATSATSPHGGVVRELRVPRFSQQIHRGEYPRYNGGGEAWCSPTSTSMLLAYWDRGPTPQQYAWVNDSYRQPWVDYAARYTFAWGYDGTGDWPFNTAYAARFRTDAFVTRLRSLREAELFIKAGIPLVASISFGPGELDGAPISSTSGHVVVIVGFTRAGSVIVNDPAGRDARHVRHVYRRGQFENAWLDSSGGVTYVIHPVHRSLPTPAKHSNW